MAESTDLVPLKPDEYPALDPNNPTLAIMRDNLGGEPITAAELARVRMPTGGGTAWTIPGPEGDESNGKLVGVILTTTRRRAYWSNPEPTGDPPDCSSFDCATGHGQPGGECAKCPLNEFGSAVKPSGKPGRGKACKEGRVVLLLRKGDTLPLVLVVSPASLRPMRQYLAQLAAAGHRYYEVVTELALKEAKNRDSVKYAQAAPRMVGRLDGPSREAVAALAREYEAALAAFQVAPEDLNGGATEEV